jgi:hypothetical protein
LRCIPTLLERGHPKQFRATIRLTRNLYRVNGQQEILQDSGVALGRLRVNDRCAVDV